MLRALFMRLPVHAGGPLVVNLHAIHAAVALAGFGIFREHHGQRDEAARRPAASNAAPGNSSSEKSSLRITSLHGPPVTIFGKNEPISASFGSIFSLPISPCGMRISRYSEMRGRDLVHRVDLRARSPSGACWRTR